MKYSVTKLSDTGEIQGCLTFSIKDIVSKNQGHRRENAAGGIE